MPQALFESTLTPKANNRKEPRRATKTEIRTREKTKTAMSSPESSLAMDPLPSWGLSVPTSSLMPTTIRSRNSFALSGAVEGHEQLGLWTGKLSQSGGPETCSKKGYLVSLL